MRAAIYTRISDDPTGREAGVDRQLNACRELAGRLGWEIVEVFSDNDISAYNGKRRPGFEALLTAMKAGRFSGLVVWHVDRLYRSMKDLERLIDIAEVGEVQINSVNSGNIDLTNSAGKMIARILGSVARQESEHHAERRRDANKAQAQAGRWRSTGMRCYGYDRTGVPLEPEATLLRTAARDIRAGRSLSAIATEMNAAGHRTVNGARWTNLHLRRALMVPRIAGLSVHQGKIVGPGNWEPILDKAVWEDLCVFLKNPARKTTISFERKHVGSGIYRCGYRTPDADPADPDSICGRKLYAAYPHGQGRSMTYTCRPRVHLGRNGAALDRYVEGVALGQLIKNRIGTGLRQTESNADIAELRAQRDALMTVKDQLATLLRTGVLDVAGVEREATILTGQITALNIQLADAVPYDPTAALLHGDEDPTALADDALLTERWAAASPDIKGTIIGWLMDVVVLPAPRGTRDFDADLIELRWH
jgi:site-specific DNA recombinase